MAPHSPPRLVVDRSSILQKRDATITPKSFAIRLLSALLVCTAVTLELAGCASAPAPRQTLVIATGAPGGAFAEYGPGIGKVIAAHSRFDLGQKPTAVSNDNVRLVNDASVPLGLVNMGPAYEAWTGSEAWKGQSLTNLRALVPMYETPFHVIALKSSGIRSLRDLQGKRVGVGPAKGPAENFFRALTDSLGIRTTLVNGIPSDNAA